MNISQVGDGGGDKDQSVTNINRSVSKMANANGQQGRAEWAGVKGIIKCGNCK